MLLSMIMSLASLTTEIKQKQVGLLWGQMRFAGQFLCAWAKWAAEQVQLYVLKGQFAAGSS